MARKIFIRGIGSYLPEKVLTNGDLEKIVDTTDEWIMTRTGISERHIAADDQATSDLATEAAKLALADASFEAKDLDAIFVATVTPDTPFPSTACFVQQKIAAGNCPCAGIEVGCSGIVYMLEFASGLLERGPYKNILIIAADKLSSVIDWTDRSTCVILADGAAALLLSTEEKGAHAEYLGGFIAANGAGAELLWQPGGGSRNPATAKTVADRLHFLKMNGKEVFKNAVKDMAYAVEEVFRRCGVGANDIAYFIPHQANIRILEAIAEYIHMPIERFISVIKYTGNTSSASLAIAMDIARRQDRFKGGDLLVPVAFGAGLTSSAALLRWIK
jgi:3-oxoacyl-[acyl-carrier-protein] synthase-3